MKKIIFCLAFMMMLMMGFSSCTSCNGNKVAPVEPVDTTEVVVSNDSVEVAPLVVERLFTTDRQDMYTNYAKDYRWFESCVLLKDYLDSEDCDGTISGVSNIFQVVTERADGGADVNVVMFAHTPDSTVCEVKVGFWVEDLPMNDEAITVTFAQAYELAMKANCPKPHSRHCVLRKQLGPVDANPQWIFGNARAQIYVDATTGNVTTENPVFPSAKGFKMPLGEWP